MSRLLLVVLALGACGPTVQRYSFGGGSQTRDLSINDGGNFSWGSEHSAYCPNVRNVREELAARIQAWCVAPACVWTRGSIADRGANWDLKLQGNRHFWVSYQWSDDRSSVEFHRSWEGDPHPQLVALRNELQRKVEECAPPRP